DVYKRQLLRKVPQWLESELPFSVSAREEEKMKISPIDIRESRFKTALRGYDRKDVEAFLTMVARDFENLLMENNELKETIRHLNNQIEEFKTRESSLREAVIAAQKVANEMKEAAKKEADIILSKAEFQADRIIENANRRVTELLKDISELKRQKIEFINRLQLLLEGHTKLLQVQKEDENIGRDSNIAIFEAKYKASSENDNSVKKDAEK
ncbi:MAG: DivIVA domain-containing protein, partial [Deltaproteobacteria bacterium]|nr:DivIVA domain-containing protein [Deltaproteobacteria bacterium]